MQESVDQERIRDWEKTSLNKYVRYFKQHVDRIVADESVVKKEDGIKMGGMAMNADIIAFWYCYSLLANILLLHLLLTSSFMGHIIPAFGIE